MIIAPAVLAFVLSYGGAKRILKDKHLYFAFLLFVLIAGAWYFGREIKSAGYLQAISETELGGRFFDSDSLVNRKQAHFYLTYLWNEYPWGTAIFGGSFLFAILCRRKTSRQFALYLAFCIVFYLSILSMATTKIWWYMLPILPLMGLIIAGIGVPITHRLKKIYSPSSVSSISLFLVVLFFAIPFANIMKNIKNNEFELFYQAQDDFGNYLRQTGVLFDRDERKYGKTNYPLRKMLGLAIDGITGFSSRPLEWVTKLGALVSLLSFFVIIYALISHFLLDKTVSGWTSVIVSSMFLGGDS